MQVVRIAMLIGVLAVPSIAPVVAQDLKPGFRLNEGKQLTDEEKERNRANEEAAKAARAKIPDAKQSSDPWATVRSEPAASTTAHKAKPKAAAK